jgi:hypothetical protein
MLELPGLRLLLEGYLTLDWPEDYDGDPWAAIDAFAASEPSAAEVLPVEVRQVLAQYPKEEDVRGLVVDKYHSGYLAEADGHSYRDWLAQVARRVSQHGSNSAG